MSGNKSAFPTYEEIKLSKTFPQTHLRRIGGGPSAIDARVPHNTGCLAIIVGQLKRMDLLESTAHSFIVKLWLEEAEGKSDQLTWHGYITHVPSGTRRYVKTLSDIPDFITQYVTVKPIHGGLKSRVSNWLKWFALNSLS